MSLKAVSVPAATLAHDVIPNRPRARSSCDGAVPFAPGGRAGILKSKPAESKGGAH